MRVKFSAALAAAAAIMAFLVSSAFAAVPEAPVTEAPAAVTGTTETLMGELNPGVSNEKVTYHFAYSVGAGAVCTESGLTAPAEPFPEAAGNHKKVTEAVTGLEGSTEYTVCLVAANPAEPAESTPGSSETFTTLASKPVLVSQSTSGETPFAATLNAEINPENQAATSCEFEYGKTEFEYGKTITYGKSATCEPNEPLEGPSVEARSAPVAGLEAGTTYHYHVVVTNATGETKGVDGTFKTLTAEKPVVEGESVSGLSSTAVKGEAKVNPNYQKTACVVRYWPATEAESTGPTVPCTPTGAELGEGSEAVAVSAQLEHLIPGTTYDYRVIATNATGETLGSQAAFTTLDTPAVTTGAAVGMTRTTATFSGTVDPAGAATSYYFAYVNQAGYEAALAAGSANPYADGRTTSQVSVGSSYEPQAAGPLTVEELTPGTTYHYAVIAVNSLGTTIGPDQVFTTGPPTPPAVSTGGAEGVSQLSASITGTVNTQGLSTVTQFEFGTSAYSGEMTPATVTSSSGTTIAIAAVFAGDLQPGATYYYRALASNQDGTTYGTEQSFMTGSFPAALAPSAAPALLPYISIAELDAREVQEGKKTPPKPLTKAQKLAKALKACTKKPKKQRAGCKRQARMKYGTSQKKKSSKK
jgi:hypothetical protein